MLVAVEEQDDIRRRGIVHQAMDAEAVLFGEPVEERHVSGHPRFDLLDGCGCKYLHPAQIPAAARNCAHVFPHVNFSARALALRAYSTRIVLSKSSLRRCSARPSTESRSNNRPASPTTSGAPPVLDTTLASPHAIPSRMVRANGSSQRDGTTLISASRRACGSVARDTCPGPPHFHTCALQFPRELVEFALIIVAFVFMPVIRA